ncbi:MAG: hypothetical protein SVW57_08845 [Thermodesulfobacteriota bacterium]|nr:hypothetical protein [Thermodesulfobacteriota bacterium]
MIELDLRNEVNEKIKPFFDEILSNYTDNVHSLYVTGSALTKDFDPKVSDINSVIVLKKMDLKFLELIAPLGKKYGKKRVSAPLIMTPEYIINSLDVFPIEFLNIQILHKTVYGEDSFQDIEIRRDDLRHQCERELKVKLIGLRQGYIASSGDRRILTDGFVNSFSGYIPLFRGIILLLGKEPPKEISDVLNALEEATGVNTRVFHEVLREKKERIKLSIEKLNTIFEDYYKSIETLGHIVDEIK